MLKVLIVEDDLLIADMVESRLIKDGFTVCGIATNVAEGVDIASQSAPDLAVIDVRLADGDLGTTLAFELKRMYKIGILYATGNIDMVIRDAVGEGCIKKPYRLASLSNSLKIINDILHKGSTTMPHPDGLLLLNI